MTDRKSSDHGRGNRNAKDGLGSDQQKIERDGKKEGWREDRERVDPANKDRDRDNEGAGTPNPIPIPPNPD